MSTIQMHCKTVVTEDGEETCIQFDQPVSEEKRIIRARTIPGAQDLPADFRNFKSEMEAEKAKEQAKARFQTSNVFLQLIR
ncbi:MAG: hypothetical protein ACFFEF_07555 [Candidatus Thorarchaeota archaeon]